MTGSPAGEVRAILLAAIRAADPHELTTRALRDWSGTRSPAGVTLVAVGKAAGGMARGAHDALGDALRGGIVIGPGSTEPLPPGVRTFKGGHPMPDAEGARGALAVAALLRGLPAGSRVLALISGGSSAMMTLPAEGLALGDIVETSRALMAAGADIRELNCVRKHLDQLKGGRMARLAAGAVVRGLVLSDVIGDPLDVIGSGPLVPDTTTYDDAVAVLRDRGLWDAVPSPVRSHLLSGARGEWPETPKEGDPCFADVTVEVIGNNALAVRGAADEARRRGFDVEIVPEPIAGEAREAGAAFSRRVLAGSTRRTDRGPLCIVGGGETTVTVSGRGIGGRNLEFAAAAALVIAGASGVAVGSIGTDGRDGPTDAAGAVADASTVERARLEGADLADALRRNDTLVALDAADAVMRTGPTGTNVMDVQAGVAGMV